jgi:RimJ/RimL family protein N-acetyltransferase
MASYDKLRPIKVSDGLKIRKLVRSNPDLSEDFPGVVDRYSGYIDALRAARWAASNPDVSAFVIECAGKVGGVATYSDYGPINALGTNVTVEGHNVAGWLDESLRGRSVAKSLGIQLVDHVVNLDHREDHTPWTVTRVDNIAAIKLASYLMFKPLGEPGNYNDQIKDGVTADRQLFTIPVVR